MCMLVVYALSSDQPQRRYLLGRAWQIEIKKVWEIDEATGSLITHSNQIGPPTLAGLSEI